MPDPKDQTNQAEPAAPAPAALPAPHAAPAPLSLMERVQAAKEDLTPQGTLTRMKWRHCFHEAAHAFVGRHYGETVTFVEVIVPPGQRPRAGIGKKNLRDLAAAVKAHGKSCAQAIEPITRFFAYLSAGEALEIEVEQLLDPFPNRVNAQWDTNFGKLDSDLRMIVTFAQEAGFDHRQDLLLEGWNRAKAIIADNRAAYEALVIRLFDGGNIEQPELEEYLPALPA